MGAYDLHQRNQPRRNPTPSPNPNHRKRIPEKKTKNNNGHGNNKNRPMAAANSPAKKLVLGEVKILKRGEDLTVFKKVVHEEVVKNAKKADDLPNLAVVLPSSVPSTPEPVKIPKQSWMEDLYAGSAIYSSPSPRSLPLPGFFMKKTQTLLDASNDLQRLLRLEL